MPVVVAAGALSPVGYLQIGQRGGVEGAVGGRRIHLQVLAGGVDHEAVVVGLKGAGARVLLRTAAADTVKKPLPLSARSRLLPVV